MNWISGFMCVVVWAGVLSAPLPAPAEAAIDVRVRSGAMALCPGGGSSQVSTTASASSHGFAAGIKMSQGSSNCSRTRITLTAIDQWNLGAGLCLGGAVVARMDSQEACGSAPVERQQITEAMVLRALRRVTLPKPEIVIQPPGGKTLVNFETIFHTEAEPFTRSVRLLGVRVDLEITPTSYTWAHGDGTTQTTTESGVGYHKSLPMSAYITHEYAHAGVTLKPQVSTTYSARFRVDGGAWRDVSGTVTSQGGPIDLRVVEARTVLLSGY